MPKRKKRTPGAGKKKKDDSPDNISECDSLERPPSAKKVAASSTSQLEEEAEAVSSFTSISLLNSSKPEAGETGGLSSHFWCNYCEFSADDKKELVTHMRQHMIKCSDCPFSSLSRSEVVRHCKYEHNKDFDSASQEVDSSSTDCEMDKDPCSACVFCSFLTYSTEHLEKHTAQKHPGLLAKSVAKMITKQASAEIRRDDALFYQSVTGLGGSTKTSVPAEPSGPVIIDATDNSPEDIKPEVKPKVETKPLVTSDAEKQHVLNPVKSQLASDIFTDILTKGEQASDGNAKETETSSQGTDLRVKVETMYCLTCPYSNVYSEKIKCHTFVQHPVGAAVATYNSSGESSSLQDLTFFCVREDCSHTTSDCASFQRHLISCCAVTSTLTVLEKERLKSTVTYILDHLKKLNHKTVEGFFAFASPFLGSALSLYETSDPFSSSNGSQSSLLDDEKTSKNEVLNKPLTSMHPGYDSIPVVDSKNLNMPLETYTTVTLASNASFQSQTLIVTTATANLPMDVSSASSHQNQNFQGTIQDMKDSRSHQINTFSQPVAQVYQSTHQTHSDTRWPQQDQGSVNLNMQTTLTSSSHIQQINSSVAPNSFSSNLIPSSVNSTHEMIFQNADFISHMGEPVLQGRVVNQPSSSSVGQGLQTGYLQTTSDGFLSANPDICSLESQPQPRMMDLLSDSYSILLSDDPNVGAQPQNMDTNSQNQSQIASLAPHFSYQESQMDSQNQNAMSQSPSLMPSSSSQAFMQGTISNTASQLPQISGNPGMLHTSLSASQSPSNYTGQNVTSAVPNFLVTTGTTALDGTSIQGMCSLNQGAQADALGTSTPPRNGNSTAFSSASPLSPSIYLRGQAPRRSTTNWISTDMQPRGVQHLPPMRPRGIANARGSPVTNPRGFSNVRQRLFMPPTQRSHPRAARGSRGRMPQSRMSGAADDDDEVIVTAVTRIVPQQQQNRQSPGRPVNHPGRGSVPVSHGQAVPGRSRARGQNPYPRAPHPVPLPLHLPQKQQFDISKHFEDLACVVNSSADEEDMNRIDDDLEIVGVTPGKDRERNQPKAVDASKFSFCCVHCGKDQGSKKVMKQHMKARHNDSLLGAFTNIETGQLLFFCPQLTCEFMTYDERRLSEHLSKCFDLDKSKPFDFGTAIKNLKSLKIRQMDVRSVGGSEVHPIGLDGQGMKDNFSSSLNDAFDDIVVNTSGRQIVRPASQPPSRSSSHRAAAASLARGAIRGPMPLRHQSPGGAGMRMRPPGYPESPRMPYRGQRSMRQPRVPNSRQGMGVPGSSRTGSRNTRGMYPQGRGTPGPYPQQYGGQIASNPNMQGLPPYHHNPQIVSQGGSQQEPIVIDLDADSPERPHQDNIESRVATDESLQVSNSSASNVSVSTVFPNSETVPVLGLSQLDSNMTSISNEQSDSFLASQSGEQMIHAENSQLSDTSAVSSDVTSKPAVDCVMTTAVLQNLSSFVSNLPLETPMTTNTSSAITEPISSTENTQSHQDVEDMNQTSGSDAQEMDTATSHTCSTSQADTVDTPYDSTTSSEPASSVVTSAVAVNKPIQGDNHQSVPPEKFSAGQNSAATIPAPSSDKGLTSLDDEEERVNAVVLEKVFAKVPNMPKNLSRRLVSKFKQYANYRGVKITADSKVIDEFVSKIYYKGSNADKDGGKTPTSVPSQPVSSQPPQQPDGTNVNQLSNAPTTATSTAASENHQMDNQQQREPVRECESHEASNKTLSPPPQPSLMEQDNGQVEAVKEISSETNEPDKVIATRVILALRNVQLRGTFGDTLKKSAAAAKCSQDLERGNERETSPQTQSPHSEIQSDARETSSQTQQFQTETQSGFEENSTSVQTLSPSTKTQCGNGAIDREISQTEQPQRDAQTDVTGDEQSASLKTEPSQTERESGLMGNEKETSPVTQHFQTEAQTSFVGDEKSTSPQNQLPQTEAQTSFVGDEKSTSPQNQLPQTEAQTSFVGDEKSTSPQNQLPQTETQNHFTGDKKSASPETQTEAQTEFSGSDREPSPQTQTQPPETDTQTGLREKERETSSDREIHSSQIDTQTGLPENEKPPSPQTQHSETDSHVDFRDISPQRQPSQSETGAGFRGNDRETTSQSQPPQMGMQTNFTEDEKEMSLQTQSPQNGLRGSGTKPPSQTESSDTEARTPPETASELSADNNTLSADSDSSRKIALVRSNSFSSSQTSTFSFQVRKSNSIPQNLCEIPEVAELNSYSENDTYLETVSASSSFSMSLPSASFLPTVPALAAVPKIHNHIPNFLSLETECSESEVYIPVIASALSENSPVISKDVLTQLELIPTVSSVAATEVAPIVIDSSVDDLIAGHPELEVDIAGKPCKEEVLDNAGEEQSEIYKTLKDISIKPDSPKESKSPDIVEKSVTQTTELIDRTTGQLMFKKKKGDKPRLKAVKSEDKDDENHDAKEEEIPDETGEKYMEEEKSSNSEELFVRRSSRSRKPVHLEMDVEINEIDELMSDTDDEYNIDNDDDSYGTDSGSERSDGSGQSKKKMKKVKPPPDPTAFNVSTKGKFKCWLCKKIFNKCTSVKVHIIKKHGEGLCTFNLSQPEDTKTAQLLLFCPRLCKYVTESLDGLMSHRKMCDEPPLKDDPEEKYGDITDKFLETKYSELLRKDHKEILAIGIKKRERDPAKNVKSKKRKLAAENEPSVVASVIIPHSEATVPSTNFTAIDSVAIPSTPSQSITIPPNSGEAERQIMIFSQPHQSCDGEDDDILSVSPEHQQPEVSRESNSTILSDSAFSSVNPVTASHTPSKSSVPNSNNGNMTILSTHSDTFLSTNTSSTGTPSSSLRANSRTVSTDANSRSTIVSNTTRETTMTTFDPNSTSRMSMTHKAMAQPRFSTTQCQGIHPQAFPIAQHKSQQPRPPSTVQASIQQHGRPASAQYQIQQPQPLSSVQHHNQQPQQSPTIQHQSQRQQPLSLGQQQQRSLSSGQSQNQRHRPTAMGQPQSQRFRPHFMGQQQSQPPRPRFMAQHQNRQRPPGQPHQNQHIQRRSTGQHRSPQPRPQPQNQHPRQPLRAQYHQQQQRLSNFTSQTNSPQVMLGQAGAQVSQRANSQRLSPATQQRQASYATQQHNPSRTSGAMSNNRMQETDSYVIEENGTICLD